MPTRSLFIADTYVNEDPDAETLAEITLLAADEVLRFGIQPKVALLSHSQLRQLGSSLGAQDGARRWRCCTSARPRSRSTARCTATPRSTRRSAQSVFPNSRLKDAANLVICPTLDAANIAFNLLKTAADGLHIGPMLLGTARPAHVLTPSVTARGILNMTALGVVEAQRLAEERRMSGEPRRPRRGDAGAGPARRDGARRRTGPTR